MTTRYSMCHFAEVMFDYITAKHIGAIPEEVMRCSFCGESCELVPQEFRLNEDVELTLRRWKDGDCSLDQMFKRVNSEFYRAWKSIFDVAKTVLQAGNEPLYEQHPGYLDWTKRDDGVSKKPKRSEVS